MSVLRLQCTKMLTKCWGAPPDRLAEFKGPTSKGGMAGEGSGGEEIGGEERNGKGRKGKNCGVHYILKIDAGTHHFCMQLLERSVELLLRSIV